MINSFIKILFCFLLIGIISCRQDESIIVKEFDNLIQKDTTYTSFQILQKNDSILDLQKNLFDDSISTKHYIASARWYKENIDIDNGSLFYQKALEVAIANSKIQEDELVIEIFSFYRRNRRIGDLKALVYQLDKKRDTSISYRAFVLNVQESQQLLDQDYKAALSTNKIRVKLLEKINAQDHINDALTSRVHYYYNYLSDKNATYELLDSLLSHKNKLNHNLLNNLYTSYGVYKFYDGDYQSSLNYYNEALDQARLDSLSMLQTEMLANSFANISEVQIKLGKYDEASKSFNEFYELDQVKLSDNIKASVLKYELRHAYNSKNSLSNLEESLESLTAFHIDNYKVKTNQELEALKSSMEKSKQLTQKNKEIEIARIQTQKGWVITIASFLLISVLIYVLYIKRSNQSKINALFMQQRLLRSQLNPHFTFNTLYSIQNLISTDQQKASGYLQKFTRLLRNILENSLENYVQLEDEINALEEYLALQQLRFPDKFNFTISLVDLEIDDLIYIPPMLIQPFAENSLEHGFKGLSYQGDIIITLSRKLKETNKKIKFIHCIIKDNGKGMVKSVNQDKKSTSFQLIDDFLKKSTGTSVKMDSNTDGTVVSFNIPVKQ